MTKQEQIEEMASNVENAIHNHCRMFVSCNCNDCEFLKYRSPKTDCQAMCIAENLYNLNYRKIDDDCAVITKSELKQYKVQAVKEFAERLKTEPRITDLGLEFVALVDIDAELEALLKEYEKWKTISIN